MKAIIDGKRYDTGKATELGSYTNMNDTGDFGYYYEKLYKTPRSGAYFLAGAGNARSRYATDLGGGSWGGGDRITPLTDDEAFAWAQEHLRPDQVEDLFGDRIEDA